MTRYRSTLARVGRRVLVVAIGLTLAAGVAPVGAVTDVGAAGTNAGVLRLDAAVAPGWRREMLARINAVRLAAGARPLKPCPALRRSAQEYAMLMTTRDFFGHIGLDGSHPVERMQRQGYLWRAAAENIAAGQRSVNAVMAAWVGSPVHYATLVNPAYRHVGLGFWSSGASFYGAYWVQDFGRGRGC